MSSTQNQPQTVYSLRDLADRGYGAYSTLRGHVAAGRLPSIRVGNRIKIRQEDLDAFVAGSATGWVEDDASVIRRVVAKAPTLTQAQREDLAMILGGGASA